MLCLQQLWPRMLLADGLRNEGRGPLAPFGSIGPYHTSREREESQDTTASIVAHADLILPKMHCEA